MPRTNKEIEELIEKALEKLHTQSRPNISKVAREFDVPYQRLRSRYRGKKSLFEREPNGRKLDPAQEKALCGWIDYNDSLGVPVKRTQIVAAATSILKLANPSSPPLSEKWLKRFLQRHPKYNIRRRKSLDIERLHAHDKSLIQEWFQRFQNAFDLYGVQPEDLYDFDETGFQIGIGKDQWIITREPRRKIVSGNPNIHTKTIQRFQRLESRLLTLNKDISHYENIVKKLSKGAQSCAYQLEEAHREIETSKAATAARHARYANVAKMKQDKQKLTDLEAIDKLRPQWKKVMIELKRHCRQSGRRLKR
ncbi:hypothetical protein N7532_000137 [Penicillium argentinense]|uniref:HTH CENPB-type domain-containing protein n=1 Tax=Penicillium argentinense TaxID=1131581 RepID=A0A9W9G4Z2_9EURO|nr:uncharacterized protein N7532_000137 [Penicillium argentinense]KAJ5112092.1 hypothetical protein N7532_000137 [Penicillium argentinense]